ncbi:MAG: hypothetical protein NT000_09165, partial [Proteobacteria bacterium]|nr:hypothetical protein [Pseudomonadota bacterium]
SSCSSSITPITSINVSPSLPTSSSIYFKVTSATATSVTLKGTVTATATAIELTTLLPATVSISRTATALKFNSPPTALNVGVCSGAFTVSAIDGLGNPFSEGIKTVVLGQSLPLPSSLPLPIGAYYSDSSCSSSITPITSINVSPSLPTSSSIYFKVTSATATSVTLNGTFTGLTSASATVTISRTATALKFNNPPTALNVGVCSGGFTVSALDGLGNVFSESSKSVILGQSSSVGVYYSNSNCTTPIINPINIPQSSTTVLATSSSIYFKVTSVTTAPVTLNGTFTGLTSASATVTISHLVLDTTFGSNGKTIPNPVGEILALEKYGDGYLIAGYTKVLNSNSVSVNRAYLALLNTAGGVTSSFTDLSGAVTSSFIDSSTGRSSQINSILVVGTDIYVGGFADMGGTLLDYYISKFSLVVDSNLNPTGFNRNWTVTQHSQDSDSVIGLALNNNSNLVVIGDKFEVLLFNSVDGGYLSNIRPVVSGLIAYKAVKNSSGNIIIAGEASGKMAALSVNPNASPPSPPMKPLEFNPPGSANSIVGSANSIVLQGDNIFLMGTSEGKLTVLKLNSSLVLVSTLVSELLENTVMTQANDIVLDSAGNILIVGTTSNQMALRRYQPNGSFIDASINSTTISFSPSSVANRIILDGFKIVLGGNVGTGMGMARLHP